MDTEAILAAIEQARAALDQIEMEHAAQKPPEEEPKPEAEEGEAPPMPGGMMGKKMMGA